MNEEETICISPHLEPTLRPLYPTEFAKLFELTKDELREIEQECISTLYEQTGHDMSRPTNVVDFRKK
jgi:hypothetical protein